MSEAFERDEEDELELIPSELDDRSHAELLMMYNESALSIRFQKTSQWKALAMGVFILLTIIVFCEYSPDRLYGIAPWLIIISTVTTTIFGYVIFVYHLLQSLERKKIVKISESFSNLFQEIRSIKSPVETAFHRYTLLLVMLSVLIGFCVMSIHMLSRYVY
ncbi:hypothetical protein [Curvivirga aplysinae]|uniref:hypothetical protein n=1 Tax=Curvivirga aplysinae TaxID=2529852 RepID=UPI0012BD3DB6|nr:hypothetical protein [Curvivirga aplysinae]MTI09901.1 hypothetical protein [Curvivirga aplysinae]